MQSGNCLANCRWGTGCMYWRNNPEFSGREVSTWIVTHPKITQVQAWTLNKANIPPSGVDVGFSWNAIPVRSCVRRSVTIPPHFFNSVVFFVVTPIIMIDFYLSHGNMKHVYDCSVPNHGALSNIIMMFALGILLSGFIHCHKSRPRPAWEICRHFVFCFCETDVGRIRLSQISRTALWQVWTSASRPWWGVFLIQVSY